MVAGNIYVRSSATNELSVGAIGPASANMAACSASNVVNEVAYTVFYSVTSKGYYQIADIRVDMILLDTVTFDDNSICSGDPTNGALFH